MKYRFFRFLQKLKEKDEAMAKGAGDSGAQLTAKNEEIQELEKQIEVRTALALWSDL